MANSAAQLRMLIGKLLTGSEFFPEIGAMEIMEALEQQQLELPPGKVGRPFCSNSGKFSTLINSAGLQSQKGDESNGHYSPDGSHGGLRALIVFSRMTIANKALLALSISKTLKNLTDPE